MPQSEFEVMARDVVGLITYKPGYAVICQRDAQNEGGRLYYQAVVQRVDIVTTLMGEGKGGKAYLSEFMVLSELVRTAFGLLLAYEEHECREHFKFDGKRVFGPHIDVRALMDVADRFDVRKMPPQAVTDRAERVSAHLRLDHPEIDTLDPHWQFHPLVAHEAAHRDGEVVH